MAFANMYLIQVCVVSPSVSEVEDKVRHLHNRVVEESRHEDPDDALLANLQATRGKEGDPLHGRCSSLVCLRLRS